MSAARLRALAVAVAVVVFALDHLTKLAIERHFRPGPDGVPAVAPSVEVLGDALRLTYSQNRGVVFGIGNRSDRSSSRGLVVFVLVATALLGAYFWRVPAERRALLFGLGLVLGGAAGNLVDRLLRGYVVDFVDVSLHFMRWYAFNLADAAIVTGVGLMLIDQLGPGAKAAT